MKCPKCQQGDLFESSSFGYGKKSFEMPEKCPVCGQTYMPEPGFYYGAMFLSYIMTGFFSIFFMVVVHWVLGLSLVNSFIILILILAAFFVFIFRFSRALWLNMMVR